MQNIYISTYLVSTVTVGCNEEKLLHGSCHADFQIPGILSELLRGILSCGLS
jgi:hypothetical protein